MKKRFWKFLFAVLSACALQGAELGNKDGAHVGPSVRRVDFRRRGLDCELYIEGKLANRCTVMDADGGRIGFQTRPYPEGKAPILYRNMILTPHDE